jgi:hypothetical protein
MAISLEMQGIPEVLARLQRLNAPVTQSIGQALHDEGNRIMNESVRLVPVDTGLLRSTAAVSRPEQTGQEVTVELRYGGHGLAPYAMVVHFRTDVHHPIGQSHYLQQPLFQATAGFGQRIATALRPALRSS